MTDDIRSAFKRMEKHLNYMKGVLGAMFEIIVLVAVGLLSADFIPHEIRDRTLSEIKKWQREIMNLAEKTEETLKEL